MEEERSNLFQEEDLLLRRARDILSREKQPKESLPPEYGMVVASYEKLLRQTKKLIRISDGLQRKLSQQSDELADEKEKANSTLEALIKIGKSLSQEKDHDRLLTQILILSQKTTGADAGNIFLLTNDDNHNKGLVFINSHTFSKNLPYVQEILPYDTNSIAGYVAITGKILNIANVYDLSEENPVSFDSDLDLQHGYKTKSMLVVPMCNHRDQVIGVIQLINCKEAGGVVWGDEAYNIVLRNEEDFETKVVPFQSRYEALMEAVASQAAIAIENNRMIKQIEKQFEKFVKASVAAVESRDPATSGHSSRVARMSVNTAVAANRQSAGALADVKLSETELKELEMAGLLHDFGKLYIEPSIFLKSKKLNPSDFAYLMLRLEFIHRSLELSFVRMQTDDIQDNRFDELDDRLNALKEIRGIIIKMNEPTLMEKDPRVLLDEIRASEDSLTCEDLDGRSVPLLTDHEVMNLQVRKGTLNDHERKIIESHVEHTYNFVREIPWPDEYEGIPDIVRKHHEKLNGTGYPWGISGRENIPVQSRIMAIADIYDALSAADRPYKKAIPLNRVFEILRDEAKKNQLDADLVELFISEKAYEALHS